MFRITLWELIVLLGLSDVLLTQSGTKNFKNMTLTESVTLFSAPPPPQQFASIAETTILHDTI